MQIPILSGLSADASAQFRTNYPVNFVPIPKDTSISKGYLAPADGIIQTGTGPGKGRGGINWNGDLYRVMGTKLVKVSKTGAVTTLDDVGGRGTVTLDYSFDRLGIASGGKLFYWDGSLLTEVTDPDLGTVVDAMFIAGYWMTTDGTYLVVTELNDPLAVTTTKYGSSEADPDPVKAIDKLRNEAIAFNRYTIEVFQNVGGTNFPFQRLEGAQVPKGILGTHTYAPLLSSFAFLGSGREEAPGVHLMTSGDSIRLSTREIDTQLQEFTEEQLSQCTVESQVGQANEFLYVHLPDRTLVYDAGASKAIGEAVWHVRKSGLTLSTYRMRHLIWVYDDWHCEDPTSNALGKLTPTISSHYGQPNGWEFYVPILYNQGNDAIIHEMELVALPGRVALGVDPVVWTSYSKDGLKWSMDRSARSGKQGETLKRIAWRGLGTIGQYRIQKFRGTTDTHMSIARLEAQIEPLITRPING